MEHLNIEDSSWSKSLFKRMGYVRRLATTGKVEISEKLKAEIETEALNMLENIITPYVEQQHVSLNLAFDHPALIIMDVFKGQMTCAVRELLNENHILLEKVPVNLKYLFQPLDVQGGPYGYVKRFMK